MTRGRWVWLAGAVTATLAATACGSTVIANDATSGELGPLPQVSAPAGDGPQSDLTQPDQARGSRGSAPVNGRGPDPLQPGNVDRPVRNGVGVSTLRIGVIYPADGNETAEPLGAGDSISSRDRRDTIGALFAAVNRAGGVAGRRLVADYYGLYQTSSEPLEQQQQAACAHFTSDNKVFAVFAIEPTNNFISCLERAGVLVLVTGSLSMAKPTFDRHPYLVAPMGLRLDRVVRAEIESLTAQKWFGGWDSTAGAPGAAPVRIGIVLYDAPDFVFAVDKVLVPALRRSGHEVEDDDVVRVQFAQNVEQVGATAAETSNAVLRFRSRGVTHVVFLQRGGVPVMSFLQTADNQGYRPRYGFNSLDAVPALLEGGLIPERQLAGALGTGWEPHGDFLYGTDPYRNSAPRRRCLSMLKAAGLTFTNSNAEYGALSDCGVVWFLQAAVQTTLASGRRVERSDLMRSIAAMRSGFEQPLALSTSFTPAVRDGVASYRPWRYDAACRCFGYTGPARSV